MVETETQERFEKQLHQFNNKLNQSKLVFNDGWELLNLANNLLLRYEEIRKSRDKWKTKYQELKNEKTIKK